MSPSEQDILANETRREILIVLRDRELPAGDVARTLGRAAPGVSEHLNRLSSVGVLLCRQAGVFRYYRVDPQRAFEAWDHHVRSHVGW